MSDYIESGKIPLPPFVPIFTGINEHLLQGKFSIIDLGVYTLLQLRCNWTTGIYFGCAETLATTMGGQLKAAQVRRSMLRLRKTGFINYRLGNGSRGSFPISIHNFVSRGGALEGFRLNAFAENGLEQPLYESRNGEGTVSGWSEDGGRTVRERSAAGERRVSGTPQELNKRFKDIRIQKFKNTTINQSADFSDGVIEQGSSSAFQEESLDSPLVMEKGSGRKPPSSARPPEVEEREFDLRGLE